MDQSQVGHWAIWDRCVIGPDKFEIQELRLLIDIKIMINSKKQLIDIKMTSFKVQTMAKMNT